MCTIQIKCDSYTHELSCEPVPSDEASAVPPQKIELVKSYKLENGCRGVFRGVCVCVWGGATPCVTITPP